MAKAAKAFEHEQVGKAAVDSAAVDRAGLTDDQQMMLGDLFAVVEEHTGEAG